MAVAPVTTCWGSFQTVSPRPPQSFGLPYCKGTAPPVRPPRCAAQSRLPPRRNAGFDGLGREAQTSAVAALPFAPTLGSGSTLRRPSGLGRTGARARTSMFVAAAAAAPAAAGAFDLSGSSPLAGGKLDLVNWRDGRMLRIWTPPGFSRSDAVREPYPVMYLNDGQNLYGDTPTLSGQSWHAAEAAAGLINSGDLPPFVIVGIDHGGAMRSYDYLPYPPGNANGLRPDAEKWPGGGVDAYLRALVDEILPYTERSYGVSSEPSLRGFGGSSFGGICGLCAAMRVPGVFGSLLVESPSLWFAEGRLLKHDLPDFQGTWPTKVFLAMGSQEYSGIRSPKQPEFDAQLVASTHHLAALLAARGLQPGVRLAVEVEEGATHNEAAWAGRLPAALRFLGQHWRSALGAAKHSA